MIDQFAYFYNERFQSFEINIELTITTNKQLKRMQKKKKLNKNHERGKKFKEYLISVRGTLIAYACIYLSVYFFFFLKKKEMKKKYFPNDFIQYRAHILMLT